MGPLAQIATTGDLFQFGFSGQMKLWVDLPGFENRLKLNVQGGLGFLHADMFTSDDAWLIPVGVGLDYALNPSVSLTSTFLFNFNDVDTGHGTGAHATPGLTFGLRF